MFVSSQKDGAGTESIAWKFILSIDILGKEASIRVTPKDVSLDNVKYPYTIWELKEGNNLRGYFLSIEKPEECYSSCKDWVEVLTGFSCSEVSLDKVDKSMSLRGYIDQRNPPKFTFRFLSFVLPFDRCVNIILGVQEGLNLI